MTKSAIWYPHILSFGHANVEKKSHFHTFLYLFCEYEPPMFQEAAADWPTRNKTLQKNIRVTTRIGMRREIKDQRAQGETEQKKMWALAKIHAHLLTPTITPIWYSGRPGWPLWPLWLWALVGSGCWVGKPGTGKPPHQRSPGGVMQEVPEALYPSTCLCQCFPGVPWFGCVCVCVVSWCEDEKNNYNKKNENIKPNGIIIME